jgi:hypothetical protein
MTVGISQRPYVLSQKPSRDAHFVSVDTSSAWSIATVIRQWCRDGVNIPDAVMRVYSLVADDVGTRISAQVTVAGSASATASPCPPCEAAPARRRGR